LKLQEKPTCKSLEDYDIIKEIQCGLKDKIAGLSNFALGHNNLINVSHKQFSIFNLHFRSLLARLGLANPSCFESRSIGARTAGFANPAGAGARTANLQCYFLILLKKGVSHEFESFSNSARY
jgi:hypothetical protein